MTVPDMYSPVNNTGRCHAVQIAPLTIMALLRPHNLCIIGYIKPRQPTSSPNAVTIDENNIIVRVMAITEAPVLCV